MSQAEEREHYWIKTRFQYIDKALPKEAREVIEFGCGTGQNIWYLRQRFDLESIVGVDPNLPDNFSPEWIDSKDSMVKAIGQDQKADFLVAMDVLEHIDNDGEVLKEWVTHLKGSNARMLITVPAFQSLWSSHDEILEHKRRYTKKSLKEVALSAGLEPVYLSYAFSYLFFPAWIVRKLFAAKGSESTDLKKPNFVINSIFKLLGKIEYLLGGFPLFGTSVVGIFKVRE